MQISRPHILVSSERYKSHNTRNEMAPFTVESMQLGICTNVCYHYQCASVIHQARSALSYSIFTIQLSVNHVTSRHSLVLVKLLLFTADMASF